jgi:hypothetical protein
VSFISIAAHQKLIVQCQRLIGAKTTEKQSSQKMERLQADLSDLQRLLKAYQDAVSQLPGITNEYNELQRRIRVNARKIQALKAVSAKKK